MAGLLTSNSPVSIGGLKINNPLAINNPYAGGGNPTRAAAAPAASGGGAPVAKAAAVAPADVGGYVDPYAGTVFGSTEGYNRAVADYNSLKGVTEGSIQSGIGTSAAGLHSSILDYLDQEKAQQAKINSQAVQNELSKQQGSRSILDMVGRGIHSGGVVLANDNASNSSAGDALAKAYGDIGRRQQAGVNLQYAEGGAAIKQDQDALAATNATQQRHVGESKTTIINNIVNDATSKLASLNQAAATASLPDRVAIDQEIATIKQQALSALQDYDSELANGIAANAPTSADANRASAATLLAAGTAPDNAFQFSTEVPAKLQGTGPSPSELPLFTLPRKNSTI